MSKRKKRYTTDDYTMSTEDVQKLSGYNIVYLRELARKGTIPAILRFRRWWFCEAEVRETLKYMRELPTSKRKRHAKRERGSAKKRSLLR